MFKLREKLQITSSTQKCPQLFEGELLFQAHGRATSPLIFPSVAPGPAQSHTLPLLGLALPFPSV